MTSSGCHFDRPFFSQLISVTANEVYGDQRQSRDGFTLPMTADDPHSSLLGAREVLRSFELVDWLSTIQCPTNKIAPTTNLSDPVHTVPILNEDHPVDEYERRPPPQLCGGGTGWDEAWQGLHYFTQTWCYRWAAASTLYLSPGFSRLAIAPSHARPRRLFACMQTEPATLPQYNYLLPWSLASSANKMLVCPDALIVSSLCDRHVRKNGYKQTWP